MSRFIAIYSSDFATALRIARSLSPQVEKHASGALVLTVSKRFEEQVLESLLQATVDSGTSQFGSASTRVVAVLVARFRPGHRVPDGEEARFIASFPIENLLVGREFPEKTLQTLRGWGIRRIGELAKLPKDDLVARLGKEGLTLRNLARGRDRAPFQPLIDPPRFVETEDLQWELDDLGPLIFLFGKLLDRLCLRLKEHGLATDRLEVRLKLVDDSVYRQSIPLAFPMISPKVLSSLLRLKLQSQSPEAAIRFVSLEASPARPLIFQQSLLEPNQTHPEKLSRTLSRLTALIGDKNLGTVQLLDTHQPDGFRLLSSPTFSQQSSPGRTERGNLFQHHPLHTGPQCVLRRLRPPRITQIETERIVHCSGPWKSSGNWWQIGIEENDREPRFWSRAEWDIEMIDGLVYRVFWDHRKKKYFIEGIYD